MSKSATRVGCRVQQIVNIHEGRDVFHARNFTFVTKGSGSGGGEGGQDKKAEEETAGSRETIALRVVTRVRISAAIRTRVTPLTNSQTKFGFLLLRFQSYELI